MSTSLTADPSHASADPLPRLAVRTLALDVTSVTAAATTSGPVPSASTLRRVLTLLVADLATALDAAVEGAVRVDHGPRHDLSSPQPPRLSTWWREGEGLVAWGEAARLTTPADARRTTSARWDALVARCTVHDEVGGTGVGTGTAPAGTGLVAFGSFAFDDASVHGGVLVVPRVLVGYRDGRAWLTTVVPLGSASAGAVASEVVRAALRRAAAAAGLWEETRPGPGHVREDLPATDWRQVVRAALGAIDDGEAEKVVAARALTAHGERAVDPAWLVDRLAPAYPECWTFSVDGLVGATPELLVRLEDREVTSRVLAGTLPRTDHESGAPHDDGSSTQARAIGAHLFASAKDRAEHEFAVASVTASLRTVCDEVTAPAQPFPLVLPNVIHLASDVHGTLAATWPAEQRPSASLRVAAAMHPTAAVCGTPTDAATRIIRRIEGMDRGRYAGPVGWVDAHGDGEWGIALRSAEIDPQDPARVRLFAGCGIVAGSDPDVELTESEAKLVPLREALGIR